VINVSKMCIGIVRPTHANLRQVRCTCIPLHPASLIYGILEAEIFRRNIINDERLLIVQIF